MRIGLDMLAVQSPHHGSRGIGRYSASLASSLISLDDAHEYILYVHDGLTNERVPNSPNSVVRVLRQSEGSHERVASRIDSVVRDNPDSLDVMVILSPFEYWDGYIPPARPDNGLKLVSVVYDLIPFLFQNERVVDPTLLRQFKSLEALGRYDSLLAISESTRKDILNLLALPPDRVVNISGASDSIFFKPSHPDTLSGWGKKTLAEHRIDRPFVFNVGGLDGRKNHFRLIDAFASLPEHLRIKHKLVFTFKLTPYWYYHLHEYAKERGLDGSLVLTGEVDDETLRLLYQRCEAFVFPSLYEGFGLPILEAMHCGAPVVAGNNSSQIEIIGDAGLLAEAMDVNDIATKIATILNDIPYAETLRAKGLERARMFSWDQTTARALEAIKSIAGRTSVKPRLRVDRGHCRKPTIAFLSPFPPRKSGVSDYSAFLLNELRKTYSIDLFHDCGYLPEPALASQEFMSCDARHFGRFASVKKYHAIVYQMGNSHYHDFLYSVMLHHPGVVTLHDFCLAGFHLNYGRKIGRGIGLARDELLRWYPEHRQAILNAFVEWGDDPDLIQKGCAEQGWWLNRAVFDASHVTVVHSPWCHLQVRQGSPEYEKRVAVIPHGIHPRHISSQERRDIRERFLVPQDALVVASYGFVHPDKMSPQALDSFAILSRENPKALFIFAGEEADGGLVERHAVTLGIADRVRFLGRQPAEAFAALMNITDIGVNLRLPPTNGETSGALLNLLASGVATVVTDVATFGDFPSSVVRKVHWQSEGQDGLNRAIHALANNRHERESLGQNAWKYVEQHHDWSRVACMYVEAIERCHEELLMQSDQSSSRNRQLTPHNTALTVC